MMPSTKTQIIPACQAVCQAPVLALIGSMFVTLGDGAKGFNLVKNTELAAQVLAVLSQAGCRLANV